MPNAAAPAKHPPGLQTLFFTEMWERLSYYGMRALLVLFMTDQVAHHGMGLDDKTATAIYGLYTAGVYLAALPGGWIADRLLGAQQAVWYGGILITAGHFVLGIPSSHAFFLGLILVVLGTGLLKPNISAMVGALYPEGGARRDAGFTLFYLGINLGATIGPLICSSLGERLNWHYGFTAAGFGMAFGLLQFKLTKHKLGTAGLKPGHDDTSRSRDWKIVCAALASLALIMILAMAGVIHINPIWLANRTSILIVGLALAFFGWAFFLADLTTAEKKRVVVIAILFASSALFWSGFEQAGSSLNLFADRQTERQLTSFDFLIPSGWFQSLNPAFILICAPIVAWTWTRLSGKGINPLLSSKLAYGLLLLGGGFGLLAIGAKIALAHGKVLPWWLIVTYLLHTLGELCISPVGLSSVTKLAPPRLVGQMMGIWFLATSLGNLVAGLFAGAVTGENVESMPTKFIQITIFAGISGLILLALGKPIRKLMPGIE